MSSSIHEVPSPSSSTPATPSSYDVFLSFCGSDTRNNFIDHLYAAFKRKGFIVFKDDTKLERGKFISEELLKAIKESKHAVVVISKNFASSKWCLIELNAILECSRGTALKVLPVFYHLDPSDVRKQKGVFANAFANAFAKHRDDPEIGEAQMGAWKASLKVVADIAGWHVHDSAEATVVEQITASISCGLWLNSSEIFEDVVGMEGRVAELVSLLRLEEDDVRILGIYGMGGIGKSTLAKILYHTLRGEFDGSCFVCGIKGDQRCSVEKLQQQIVYEILGESDMKIWNSFVGIQVLAQRLRNKKVFIILDDVDGKQLKELAISPRWFGQKSRIVVTNRDYQLLKSLVNEFYEVKLLNQKDAVQLFCMKAFNSPQPNEKFMDLAMKITEYAGGLPLAIKVIGSSLLGKEMEVWNGICDVLETNPSAEILDKLEISYKGLEDLSKELFLDIACFCEGKCVGNTIPILEGLGRHPRVYIDDLKRKSLLKICNGIFEMHDLILKMGKRIVNRDSSRNPGKRSRLWCPDDVVRVLNSESGTNAVEGIILEYPLEKRQKLSAKGFSKLKSLRLLMIRRKGHCSDKKDGLDTLKWHGCDSKFRLSNELSVLEWWEYPFSLLPRNFKPYNLFMFRMPFSHIKQLWRGGESFKQLRYIDLHNSQYLTETPYFSGVPNVEKLNFSSCTSLSKVCSSIGKLKKLVSLALRDCRNLQRLPKEISLESLKLLDLSGCSRLTEFPKTLGNMTSLQGLGLGRTAIEKLPSSFMSLSSLRTLTISGYYISTYVELFRDKVVLVQHASRRRDDTRPHAFSFSNWSMGLGSLVSLDLSFLNLLDGDLPSDIRCLSSLLLLHISGNKFTKIPDCICQLPKLKTLEVCRCLYLQSLSMPLLSSSSSLSYPTEVSLCVQYCDLLDGAIPNDLGYSSLAKYLSLRGNKFTILPESFCQIPNLEMLFLDNCKWLRALPKLPLSLKFLFARNCPSLKIRNCQADLVPSSPMRIACVWFSVATNNSCDITCYKILQMLSISPSEKGYALSWGPTVGSEIPGWFHKRSTNFFGAVHNHVDIDFEDWNGYALFIVYEVHGHGSSNYRVFGGSILTFPRFVCRLQADGFSLKEPLALSVPEVPSVGRNGFWVYLPAELFRKRWICFQPNHDLGFSIATSSLNVEIKECAGRLIRKDDVSEFFDVLGDITPPGLELKGLEEFKFCLEL